MNNILNRYIKYNIRDASQCSDKFNQDFEYIHQTIFECESMTELLSLYNENEVDLSMSFKKHSTIQQNMSTNADTLGQYINYIKSCNQAKFKRAIKKQHDEIKIIDDTINENQREINQLLQQQELLKLRKNGVINSLKEMKLFKVKNNENIDKLIQFQQSCVEIVAKSTNVLQKSLSQHKLTLQQLHEEKLKQFEKNHKKWDKQDTISWIMMIDNNRFSSNHKYNKFRKMLHKSHINGSSLNDLKSDLFLKYVGLGIESRTALIKNINRVTEYNDINQNEMNFKYYPIQNKDNDKLENDNDNEDIESPNASNTYDDDNDDNKTEIS